jgi:hypothetical protein
MTLNEVAVILFGLFAGYWVVRAIAEITAAYREGMRERGEDP